MLFKTNKYKSMNKWLKPIVLAVFLCMPLFGFGENAGNGILPVNLKTEFLSEPIGLDTQSPRFTWEYAGKAEHFVASHYVIQIGLSPENLQPYVTGMVFKPHTRYYWNVTVYDAKGKAYTSSKAASFEMGKFSVQDWTGKWITDRHDMEFEPAPLLRKAFSLNKQVKEARLYVAASGYYEMFINGKRVGRNYLDPGYTHFDKRILYVTHDVTSLLQNGNNAVAAVLGNGWYNVQSVAVWDFEKARWRNRPSMLCELRITFNDGSVEVIPSDNTWRTAVGPYTYNDIYSGDKYDAGLEEVGWNKAGFDDSSWQNATVTQAPAPVLTAQTMPGIRITEELKPVKVVAFGNKNYVFSFAKNFAGLCRLRVKGEAGTRITMKHGELLKENGHLEQGNINVYYHPIKPDEVFQMDVFTLRGTGEEEVFMPSFTYHGFQYVEIESSKPIALTSESLRGLFMHTDVTPVGTFSCSDTLFNKIWNASVESYLSNLHSIPTDCPQREKNGWTADAHTAIDLGLSGFDGVTLYEKWMNDYIDNQDSLGRISGIIPSSSWGYGTWPGPVWDAALFIIPNTLYNYYGATRSIERLYPTMLRYLEYLKAQEKDGGYLPFGLGDWLTWKATTNNEYTSTAYYYYDNMLMARFAKLLGKDATPFQEKAKLLKNLINKKFFNPTTGIYAEGTQTAEAIALYLGLVPAGKEQMVADKLCSIIRANNHFLDFGLLGTKSVSLMLTKYGYIEDAMQMLLKTEAPSYGNWFTPALNRTTLPETWTLSPKFNDASLNHAFFGDVSSWMFKQLAGINYDPDKPAFENILFTPHFVKELNWAKAEYKSVKGLIASQWKREGSKVVLTVTVPVGCTAEIQVGSTTKQVPSGTHSYTY